MSAGLDVEFLQLQVNGLQVEQQSIIQRAMLLLEQVARNDVELANNYNPAAYAYIDIAKTAAKLTISNPAAPAYSNFMF
ncbi:MAG: hypothetical protein V4654_05310 [Bdellovibrionota bacterium]